MIASSNCWQSIALALAIILMVDEASPLRVTTKRDDDTTEVALEKNSVTVSIRSPSGISQAVIERTQERWPESFVVRLHLQGLESLKLVSETIKLEASISSSNGNFRIWRSGDEEKALNKRSSLWFEPKLLDSKGKKSKSMPLQDGYIELQLPKALFASNPRSITLSWVDFYRN